MQQVFIHVTESEEEEHTVLGSLAPQLLHPASYTEPKKFHISPVDILEHCRKSDRQVCTVSFFFIPLSCNCVQSEASVSHNELP